MCPTRCHQTRVLWQFPLPILMAMVSRKYWLTGSVIFKGDPTKTGDITGVYDITKGILTLTSTTATVLQSQNALQSVTYKNSNTIRPDTIMRVVSFRVTSSTDTSNTAIKNIRIG